MLRQLIAGLMLMSGLACAAGPDVALHDLEGKPRNAKEFIGHGKWTIVVVWAHDCSICASEIHRIGGFHEAHKDKDAIVLGVSIDGKEKIELARRFAANHKLPFTNLIAEPEEEIIDKFGGGRFYGTPTHYFYETTGRIVGRKVGPVEPADIESFIEAFNHSPYAKKPAAAQ